MSSGELLLITGPPAVGKMTVGRAVCAASDFRLFHNHHTIEPLLEIFGFDSPAFRVLNAEFRRRVVEEAVANDTRLIFSFVWNVELPEDADYVRRLIAPYADAGLRVSCLELYADLPVRLDRNRHADRIDHKRSKRDLAWSDAHVRELEESYRMNTDPERPAAADAVLAGMPHLRLDNTHLTPDEVATRVLAWLDGLSG
ncbi:hypothetical protein FB382_002766 [Nocardioides ginsengisegetis]|uniref:AAA domain-containing protein n=1 Tax=Nocardioides ginsengisegetis TaxID=661491 RepID=A0A7W3J1A2_9ACTN|nr:AAA family ATPase [Nocardioides ginsengisegetis]MBA8804475.1 hypothetical protein [Nocardioides ginsengisegetis]